MCNKQLFIKSLRGVLSTNVSTRTDITFTMDWSTSSLVIKSWDGLLSTVRLGEHTKHIKVVDELEWGSKLCNHVGSKVHEKVIELLESDKTTLTVSLGEIIMEFISQDRA